MSKEKLTDLDLDQEIIGLASEIKPLIKFNDDGKCTLASSIVEQTLPEGMKMADFKAVTKHQQNLTNALHLAAGEASNEWFTKTKTKGEGFTETSLKAAGGLSMRVKTTEKVTRNVPTRIGSKGESVGDSTKEVTYYNDSKVSVKLTSSSQKAYGVIKEHLHSLHSSANKKRIGV